MREIFKAIPGWEGYYEISNMGRVKRLERKETFGDNRGRVKPERIRSFTSRGLTLSGGGRVERIHNVAQLVLRTFKGPALKGKPFARHLDDNHRNNELTNLRLGFTSGQRGRCSSQWPHEVLRSERNVDPCDPLII